MALGLGAGVSQGLRDERLQVHVGSGRPLVDLSRQRHEEVIAVVADLDDIVSQAGTYSSCHSASTGSSLSLEPSGGCAMSVAFSIELEQEVDGRWIAEVVELPGVLAYGTTQQQAIAQVQALALRVVADRLEHYEAGREYLDISFAAA